MIRLFDVVVDGFSSRNSESIPKSWQRWVNSDEWRGYKPGTCIVRKVRAVAVSGPEHGLTQYRFTFTIAHRENGWFERRDGKSGWTAKRRNYDLFAGLRFRVNGYRPFADMLPQVAA